MREHVAVDISWEVLLLGCLVLLHWGLSVSICAWFAAAACALQAQLKQRLQGTYGPVDIEVYVRGGYNDGYAWVAFKQEEAVRKAVALSEEFKAGKPEAAAPAEPPAEESEEAAAAEPAAAETEAEPAAAAAPEEAAAEPGTAATPGVQDKPSKPQQQQTAPQQQPRGTASPAVGSSNSSKNEKKGKPELPIGKTGPKLPEVTQGKQRGGGESSISKKQDGGKVDS